MLSDTVQGVIFWITFCFKFKLYFQNYWFEDILTVWLLKLFLSIFKWLGNVGNNIIFNFNPADQYLMHCLIFILNNFHIADSYRDINLLENDFRVVFKTATSFETKLLPSLSLCSDYYSGPCVSNNNLY